MEMNTVLEGQRPFEAFTAVYSRDVATLDTSVHTPALGELVNGHSGPEPLTATQWQDELN